MNITLTTQEKEELRNLDKKYKSVAQSSNPIKNANIMLTQTEKDELRAIETKILGNNQTQKNTFFGNTTPKISSQIQYNPNKSVETMNRLKGTTLTNFITPVKPNSFMGENQKNKLQYVGGSKVDAIFDAINPVANVEEFGSFLGRIVASDAQKSIDYAKHLKDKSNEINKQMANTDNVADKTGLYVNKALLDFQAASGDNFLTRYLASIGESDLAKAVKLEKNNATQYLINDADTEFGKIATQTALSGVELAKTAAVSLATGMPFIAVSGLQSGAQYGNAALDEGYSPEVSLGRAIAGGTTTAGVEALGGIGGNLIGKAFGKLASTTAGKTLLKQVPQKLFDYMGKVASSTAGKIGSTVIAEGTEEVAELYIQNTLDKIILDKNTPVDVKEAANNFLIGGILGGVFGGGKAISSKASNKNQTPKTSNNQPQMLTTEDLVKSAYIKKVQNLEKAKNYTIDEPPNVNYTEDIIKSAYEAKLNQNQEQTAVSEGVIGFTYEFVYDYKKIGKQMGKRGWTEDIIKETLNNPVRTVKTRDTRWLPGADYPLNDPATAFYSSDGSYVVRNDITGSITQISNKNDSNWIAPWDMS